MDWVGLLLPWLISPLLLFPRPRWIWIALAIPLSWFLNLIGRRRLLERTPLDTLLLLMLLMVGVSLCASFDVQFSIGKIAGVLLGFFVFWGIAQFSGTERRLRWMTTAFLLGAFGLALLSLIGTAWWTKFAPLSRLVQLFPTRLKGLSGAEDGFNPNAVGGSLILFIPLLIALAALFLKRRAQLQAGEKLALAGVVFLLSVILGTLVLSQSRGAWMGCSIGCLLICLFVGGWLRWIGVGVALFGSALALFFLPWKDLNQMLGGGLITGGEITLSSRLEIWSRAIYGIQDFPFTGMGMNTFREVVHVLYPLFTISPEVDIAHAHNQFLQVTLDLGIPGFVAYVGIWAAAFRLLWLVWRRTEDPFRRATALGLGGGLLSQLVFMITDAIALGAKVGIFWWVTLALVVNLARVEKQSSSYRTSEAGKPLRIWELPVLWILLSLVSISFVGDHPYLALGIALLGGTCLGSESVRKFSRYDDQLIPNAGGCGLH